MKPDAYARAFQTFLGRSHDLFAAGMSDLIVLIGLKQIFPHNFGQRLQGILSGSGSKSGVARRSACCGVALRGFPTAAKYATRLQRVTFNHGCSNYFASGFIDRRSAGSRTATVWRPPNLGGARQPAMMSCRPD